MISWSYSMYSQAMNCLACFNKAYILKVPQEGLESGDLVFGSAIHSCVNASLLGGDAALSFSSYWDFYEANKMSFSRFKYPELKEIGLKLAKRFDFKYKKQLTHKDSEKRLHAEYKGVKLEGQFDFYGLYEKETVLLDFKTSAYNYAKEKKDTALQLYLYAYLLSKNNYAPIDSLGYFVFNKGAATIQTPMVWKFEEQKMYVMLDEMVIYCKMFEDTLAKGLAPRNPNAMRHSYNCYGEAND